MKNFCMIEVFFSKSYDSYIGYVNSMQLDNFILIFTFTLKIDSLMSNITILCYYTHIILLKMQTNNYRIIRISKCFKDDEK